MNRLMLTRTYVARSLPVCAAALLVGAIAACGDDEPTGGPEAPPESNAPSPAGGGSGGEFCDSVDGIGDDLALLELTQIDDPAQFPDRVSRAAERFTGTEPPAPIAASWRHVSDFFTTADEALRDVEVTTEEDIEQALNLEGEESFAMVLMLPGQAETVGLYVQDECQVDLGITPPAVDNVCAAVDVAHLQSVFDGDVPEGEHRPWGDGTVECMWDDGNDREVGVVVMPADAMRSDLLDGMSPLEGESVQMGSGTIDVYDGAFGPLRAASGRTAATVVGETGVLASVRTGDTSAEAQKAVALVGLVTVDMEG